LSSGSKQPWLNNSWCQDNLMGVGKKNKIKKFEIELEFEVAMAKLVFGA
jgi:hypothetical protein